jgi:transcriptional regulator with XRE-family HTH domain
MKLKAWCESNPDKVPMARKRVGVTSMSWSRYLRGVQKPEDSVMRKLAAATDYAVTANDFYGIDPIRAAKAVGEFAAA